MIETDRPQTRGAAGRAVIGFLLGLLGHAIVFGIAYLLGSAVEPSQGGGFEDIAAFVGAWLLGEAVVAIGCLIGGIVLIVRGNRAMGVGLLLAWVLGALPVLGQLFGVV